MLLAELSGIEIGGCIVAIVVGVGGFITGIVGLMKKTEVKVDQPVSIAMVENLATRQDLRDHVEQNTADHKDLFSKIGGVDRGATSKISTEVRDIHARINLLDKSNGRLEATCEMQNVALQNMERKIDNLPDRVIATLRNTKAI